MRWPAWVAVGVAAVCVALVGILVISGTSRGNSAAVDELPSVAEVIAAQAHQHGIVLPPLETPASAPTPAIPAQDPFDAALAPLQAVSASEGLPAALSLLADAARASSEVAGECERLYNALTKGEPTSPAVSDVCPRS